MLVNFQNAIDCAAATYLELPELRTAGVGPFWSALLAMVPLESPADCVSVSGETNSAGMRGEKDERIDELRLSRSRAARVPEER